jgi:hypothetical protein
MKKMDQESKDTLAVSGMVAALALIIPLTLAFPRYQRIVARHHDGEYVKQEGRWVLVPARAYGTRPEAELQIAIEEHAALKRQLDEYTQAEQKGPHRYFIAGAGIDGYVLTNAEAQEHLRQLEDRIRSKEIAIEPTGMQKAIDMIEDKNFHFIRGEGFQLCGYYGR